MKNICREVENESHKETDIENTDNDTGDDTAGEESITMPDIGSDEDSNSSDSEDEPVDRWDRAMTGAGQSSRGRGGRRGARVQARSSRGRGTRLCTRGPRGTGRGRGRGRRAGRGNSRGRHSLGRYYHFFKKTQGLQLRRVSDFIIIALIQTEIMAEIVKFTH